MPSRYLYYAMEEEAFKSYIDHRNMITEYSVDLSDEKIAQIKAELQEYKKENRVLYAVDDEGVAHIAIAGAMEPKPDACAIMFGIEMTTYADIITGINAANQDDKVKSITLHFDTPGGNIVGLFKAADVIKASKKEITGIVEGMAASAGYALLSQCAIIKSENVSGEVGSIGVVTERIDYSENDKKNGIVRHTLVSKNAPDKRPDIRTEEGREKIIERITEFETIFIDYVAKGRNTSAENVKENYGRGGMLIAKKALAVGMIDGIISDIYINSADKTNQGKEKIKTEGATKMGEITLTQEQLEDIATKSATKAAETVTAKIKADLDEKDKKEAAEAKRKAGFASLVAKYPSQATLINAEMAKEGAEATADFGIKVFEAEAARLEAEKAQKGASGEKQGDLKGSGDEDKTGDSFVASMKGVI